MLSTDPTFEFPRPHRVRLVEPVDPCELQAGTAILVAAFHDGGDFLRAVGSDGRQISVLTRAAPALRTEMVLEVGWPTLANRVYVRAAVKRRTSAGELVFQVHRDEGAKMAYLLGAAAGRFRWIKPRKHRRYCVRLPLEWRVFGTTEMNDGIAEDLSAGGLSLVTRTCPVYVGDRVVVRLHAEAAGQDLVLTGSVRHVEEREGDELAVGVRLRRNATNEIRDLRRLLRAFAAKGVVLVDPWV